VGDISRIRYLDIYVLEKCLSCGRRRWTCHVILWIDFIFWISYERKSEFFLTIVLGRIYQPYYISNLRFHVGSQFCRCYSGGSCVYSQHRPHWGLSPVPSPVEGLGLMSGSRLWLFFFKGVLGFEFRARQEVYHLSYTPSPFCFSYFLGMFPCYCLGQPALWSYPTVSCVPQVCVTTLDLFVEMGVSLAFCSRQAWNWYPPNLYLLSSWDYIPPCLAFPSGSYCYCVSGKVSFWRMFSSFELSDLLSSSGKGQQSDGTLEASSQNGWWLCLLTISSNWANTGPGFCKTNPPCTQLYFKNSTKPRILIML
jgi:hypothetical protein